MVFGCGLVFWGVWGATFCICKEARALLLKSAGVGGAGRTLGSSIEASNVDTTEEVLKVQDLSNTIRVLVCVFNDVWSFCVVLGCVFKFWGSFGDFVL